LFEILAQLSGIDPGRSWPGHGLTTKRAVRSFLPVLDRPPQSVVHHALQGKLLVGHALADFLRHVGLDGQRRPHKDIIILQENDVKTSTHPVGILAVCDGRHLKLLLRCCTSLVGHGRDPRPGSLLFASAAVLAASLWLKINAPWLPFSFYAPLLVLAAVYVPARCC